MSTLAVAATLVLTPIAAVGAAMAAYLLGLSFAAIAGRKVPPLADPNRRLAILVPAHDEERVIERLLLSLRTQNYPPDRFSVFVVADNCTDATAAISAAQGAIVHERIDATARAKGHALRWLLERVRVVGPWDAYIVFDADSVVAPGFLAQMNARLAAGSRAVQGHYAVLNPADSPVTALREAALASLHYLRPVGRSALGLSCGLKGNGMCFDAATLDRLGWTSTGLAEDVELHLRLVRAGVRVDFAREALVRADMPATLEAAQSQNLRWETGRLATVRHEVLPLLVHGVITRDPVQIDAALEQLVPPLSVAVGVSTVCMAVSAVTGASLASGLAAFATGGLLLHVVAGLIAVRAPARTYVALLRAPSYILWKVALYARAVITPSGSPWVRTER